MNYDEGIEYLKSNDLVFAQLYQKLGYLPQRKAKLEFSSFVSTIVGQQLSGKAADTIFNRLKVLSQLDLTPEIVVELSPDELSAVGLSKAKIRYIQGIGEKFKSQELDLTTLNQLTTRNIYDTLIKVPGLGPWSVNILLLFNFGRLDCFPHGDSTLNKAFDELYAASGLTLDTCIQTWNPYAGIVAMYLWSYVDNK